MSHEAIRQQAKKHRGEILDFGLRRIIANEFVSRLESL